MKVLILGADGMIGHPIFKQAQLNFTTYATLRNTQLSYSRWPEFAKNTYFNIEATDFPKIQSVVADCKPAVIINCVGVVKQKLNNAFSDTLNAIEINAKFPQMLAQFCAKREIKLIHLSSDCVFSGKKGNYCETDNPDANDVYGKSKSLGELQYKNCLTLRTSTIGLELHPERTHGLIEWFLAQSGNIAGFTRAFYSGLTTASFAKLVCNILKNHADLNGLYHVSGPAISKYDLLSKLALKLNKTDLIINKNTEFFCDRTLNYQKLQKAIDYQAPSWEMMLDELVEQIKLRERYYVS